MCICEFVSARLQSFCKTKEIDSSMTILHNSISLITASQSKAKHARTHTKTNALSVPSINRLY